MNNLIGKSFKNGRGEIITVINVDSDVAILEDDQRIAVSKLLDNKHFRLVNHFNEQPINESMTNEPTPDMFNNPTRYNNLMSQLKTSVEKSPFIGESGMNFDNGLTSLKVVEPTVEGSNRSQKTDNIFIDDSQKIEQTKRAMIENQKQLKNIVENQTKKISSLLDDESSVTSVPNYIEDEDRGFAISTFDGNDRKLSEANVVESPKMIQRKENPAYQMFKNVKRSVPFKMSIDISKLLPKKEFIQMWEESYEISMIEYLAEEFFKDLFDNPEIIKLQIIEKLNEEVFPKSKEIKKQPKAATKKTTKAKITTEIKHNNDK